MRVCDAYASAAALTGDNSFESAKWFMYNLNRSIAQIGRVRPFETYVTLAHFLPKTVLTQEGAILINQGTEIFRGSGVTGVSFDTLGSGSVKLSLSTGEEKLWIISTKPGEIKSQKINIREEFGKESADVTIHFPEGMIISNLALFSSYIGDDVPRHGDYCEYNIKALVDDFMDFADLPLRHADQYLDEAYYRLGKDGIMMIPRTAPEDQYDVWYRRIPKEISYTDFPETCEDEIDVRDGMEDLLVLLLAYYMNQYSEPDVAEVFRRDYMDHLQMYMRTQQIAREGAVMNKNGWM